MRSWCRGSNTSVDHDDHENHGFGFEETLQHVLVLLVLQLRSRQCMQQVVEVQDDQLEVPLRSRQLQVLQ